MTFIESPNSSDNDATRSMLMETPKKDGKYRKAATEDTPETATSSNLSSVGSPERGAKRGSADLFNNQGSAKRLVGLLSSLKAGDLKLDDSPDVEASSNGLKHRPINLQDILSSSDEERNDEDGAETNEGVPPPHRIIWDDFEQQVRIYKATYECRDGDIPETLEEIVEANIKRIKANDLRVLLPMIKRGTMVPRTVKEMRDKMINLVQRALYKKKNLGGDLNASVDTA